MKQPFNNHGSVENLSEMMGNDPIGDTPFFHWKKYKKMII